MRGQQVAAATSSPHDRLGRETGSHLGKGEEARLLPVRRLDYCLVFRPGAVADFPLATIPQPHDPNAPLVLVRSKLAIANTTV
jgi:phosphatidylserine decarboxylase